MANEGNVSELNYSISIDISALQANLKVANSAIQSLKDGANELLQVFQSVDAVILRSTDTLKTYNDIVRTSVDAVTAQRKVLEETERTVKKIGDTTAGARGSLTGLAGAAHDVSESFDDASERVSDADTSLSGLGRTTSKTIQPITQLDKTWKSVKQEMTDLWKSYQKGEISQARYREQMLSLRKQLNLTVTPLDEYRQKLAAIEEARRDSNMSSSVYNQLLQSARQSYAGSFSNLEKYRQGLAELRDQHSNNAISTANYSRQLLDMRRSLGEVITPAEEYRVKLQEITEAAAEMTEGEQTAAIEAARQAYAGSYSELADYQEGLRSLNEERAAGVISELEAEKRLRTLQQNFGLVIEPLEEYQAKLRKLQEAHRSGAINAEQYASAVEAARHSYTSVVTASETLRSKLGELRENIDVGAISQNAYNQAVLDAKKAASIVVNPLEEYGLRVAELNQMLEEGTITQREYNATMNELQSDADEWLAKMSALISVPLLGFLAGNTYAAADFEKTLKSLQATVGDLNSDLNRVGNVSGLVAVQEVSARMAAQFGSDMSTVAGGLGKLSAAGMSLAGSVGVISTVMQVAAAGAIELDDAADKMTASYRALGLSFDEPAERLQSNFAYLANQFAEAARLTAGSVAGFASAVSSGAGEATRIFVSAQNTMQDAVNETMAVLSVYAKTGFAEGQKAGELFAMATRELTKSINEHREAWLNLVGFNPINEMTGSYKSLGAIIEALSVRFGTLQGESLKLALAQLGLSAAAIRAVAPLVQNATMMEEYRKQLMQGSDALGEFSEQMTGGLYGELNKITASLQACAVSFGNDLLPYVTRAARTLRELTSVFTELPKPVRVAVSGFALVAGSSAAALSGLIALRMSAGWLGGQMLLLTKGSVTLRLALRALAMLTFAPLVTGIRLVTANFVGLQAAARRSWVAVLGPIGLIVLGLGLVTTATVRVSKMIQVLAHGDLSASLFFKGLTKTIEVVKAIATNFTNSMRIIYQYLDEVSNGGLSQFIASVQNSFWMFIESAENAARLFIEIMTGAADRCAYAFDWVWHRIVGGAAPEFGRVSRLMESMYRGANELGDRL
ncbi:MAG: phage tail tape measure protein [Planctomycetaceae bacterium]|jgi:TP901 family phage tail tape measure protein|nr:phage tail tape measure protein [Planctomycetaceae bacterium]